MLLSPFSRARTNSGFTMIELVLVLVLLGILASVAAAKFFDMADDSSAIVCKNNRSELAKRFSTEQIVSQFSSSNSLGESDSDGAAALALKLVGEMDGDDDDLTACPTGGAYTLTPAWESTSETWKLRVVCALHGDAGSEGHVDGSSSSGDQSDDTDAGGSSGSGTTDGEQTETDPGTSGGESSTGGESSSSSNVSTAKADIIKVMNDADVSGNELSSETTLTKSQQTTITNALTTLFGSDAVKDAEAYLCREAGNDLRVVLVLDGATVVDKYGNPTNDGKVACWYYNDNSDEMQTGYIDAIVVDGKIVIDGNKANPSY